MVVYMTFRAKYCTVDNVNLLYRIHIFNFLYSSFTMATGYFEIIRGLVSGNGVIKSSLTLYLFEVFSLVLSHVVLLVYLCCPKVSINETLRDAERVDPENVFLNRVSARNSR